MPRYAQYQLRWSEHAQAYLLAIGEQAATPARMGDWLEQIASFSFHSRSGMHYTVRKQRVQRGNTYWYAYRRLHGRIVKRYLGRTADLTFARLEALARLLASTSGAQQDTPQPDRKIGIAPHAENLAPALLVSKLSPPRLPALLLDRARLFALLDAGRAGQLTLLSAPAGFGKTTLVGQWMAARRADRDFPPVAWVALEASDNDPVRFWRYLITACQAFAVDLAQSHRALLDLIPQPPFVYAALEPVLTTLLNALAECQSGGILVLEEFHVITAPQIHATIAFFIDHLPATIHLIMITRSDPPFSLARLRASNNLCEIRTADLRFSPEEMTILLQQSLASPLAAETIKRLHAQLEGWAVGLHLAKLALQRATTPAQREQTLARFPSGNPTFQEYFVSEVLELQPASVQDFLLQTSMLSRLTSSLCDALIDQHNSQEMLTLLERANLFLEPLDTAGQWYRYHALFAEAMRNEAGRRIGAEQLQQLSARASRWYAAHGLLSEAIDAALYAQDYLRAASLIERAIELQAAPGELHEPHTRLRWLEQLPETIVQQHPALCLSYATTLLFLSDAWHLSQPSLRLLEQLVQSAEARFRAENDLPKLGEIAAFRALLAWRQDESHAAAIYAQQALDWLPATQPIWRCLSLCMVGKELLETRQFQPARAALLEAQALCAVVENHYFGRISTILLAQLFFEQGELQLAAGAYRQVLVSTGADTHTQALCYALTGLAALAYERNELASADQQAQEAVALSQSHGLELHRVHATLIQARVQQAHGQVAAAQQRLAALLDTLPASSHDLVQPIQTAQAQLALVAGDHMAVQRWMTSRQPHDDSTQGLEEELLLARWLCALGKPEEALYQLECLLEAAQAAGHTRRTLEIQVELALVASACKRRADAQQQLRNVLAQALDRGYLRLLLDAGEPMAMLLRSLLPQVHEPALRAYVRTLLSAFPQQHSKRALLVEPLSPQELRVLRLLDQQRSNAEIAHELVVSVNTVGTHVQSIYRKLGVHKRSAAREIARELDLL